VALPKQEGIINRISEIRADGEFGFAKREKDGGSGGFKEAGGGCLFGWQDICRRKVEVEQSFWIFPER